MEQETNNGLSNNGINNNISKRKVLLGIFFSFLIVIFVYFFSYILLNFLFGQYLGMFLFGIFSRVPSIYIILLIVVPFLFFNSIIFFIIRNKSYKRGLFLGYSFTFIILIFSYFYINSIYLALSQFEIDQQKINTAVEQKDESLCSGIKDQYQKDHCFHDLSMCEKISDNSFWQIPCYKAVASRPNNYSYCEKLQDVAKKDICLNYVAQMIKNPTICDLIDFNNPDFLKNYSNLQIVDSITMRDSCYWYSIPGAFGGIRPLDLMKKYCPSFQYQSFKDQCITFFKNNPN